MRPVLFALAAAALLLGGASKASAGFVYEFQNYATLQNGFTLAGTITTDIDSGTLTSAHILAWSFTISSGSSSTTYDSTTAGNVVHGSATVSASAITLGATDSLSFDNGIGWSPLQYNRTGPTFYLSKPDGFTTNWFGSPGLSGLGGDPWVIALAQQPLNTVPEPASLSLLVIGMAGVVGYRSRGRKAASV